MKPRIYRCHPLDMDFGRATRAERVSKQNSHPFKVMQKNTIMWIMVWLSVGDSPPFGGRGIPFHLSQFVSILGNLYPDRGIKGSFLGMFGKMDLCKKILIQAYTSLI